MAVDLIPLPAAPVAPVFATEKENFLLIVTSSTVTGMVASHEAVTVTVVLNVIVGDAVPLLVIAAEMPVGQLTVPIVTFFHCIPPQ